MRKAIFIPLVLVGLLLSGWNKKEQIKDQVIEINITKALKDKRDVNLSEFVKNVEVLVLESNIECFMQAPYNLYFLGKKYILFHDYRQNQFFLFNRQGKFLNKIGAPGKGPGEYNRGSKATLSKDESRIIISDRQATKVMVYNIDGKVLKQADLSQYLPSRHIENLYCFYEKQLAFLSGTPYQEIDGYSNLVLFDLDLNKIGEVMPRPKDESMTCINLRHKSVFENLDGTYFWEMYRDTVYQFFPDGGAKPRYHFVVDKNKLTSEVMHSREWSRKIYNYTFPLFVNFIPGHLYVTNSGGKSGGLVLYNTENQEAYSAKLINDMFAIQVGLNRYSPDQNICVFQYRWGDFAQNNNLNKLKDKDVSQPDIRDQLIEFAENPDEDLGPVIVIMHMKLP